MRMKCWCGFGNRWL